MRFALLSLLLACLVLMWAGAASAQEITIKAELPGCQDKDIDVQVASNQLSIKGDKKADYEEAKGTYHFTERHYGTFYRSFTLPATVDTSKIRARFDKGVLEIELPKTNVATLTKVKVEAK